jgi:hypothetical protein
MSGHDIGNRVLLRKVGLLLSGSGLTADEAGRVAAKLVAKEIKQERRQQRQQRQAAPAQAISLSTATSWIVNKIAAVAQRHIERDEPSALREPRPHTSDIAPGPPASKVIVNKVADRTSTIGVWGNGPTGAQLLDDEQFHTSMHSLTTHNWRRSISENARIEAERREVWRERLASLKTQGRA